MHALYHAMGRSAPPEREKQAWREIFEYTCSARELSCFLPGRRAALGPMDETMARRMRAMRSPGNR